MAHKRRIGFTLVEMLVVISIIGLLVAISVAAFSSITKHSKVTATRGTLAAARAWVAEVAAGDPTLKSLNLTNIYGNGGLLAAPGWTLGTQSQDLAGAEQRTSQVIARLLVVPGNRASYDRLPPARKLAKDSQNTVLNPPILLDDFNNPILFVPPGGLWEVTKGGIDSSTNKPMIWGDPLPNPNSPSNPAHPPIRSPDGLSFWVSAGPDNRFDLGDDNLYSFEN